MTNTLIYLAKISEVKDYSADYPLELEAFDTYEKAAAFMEKHGFTKSMSGYWGHTENFSLEGDIITLRVK